ncbi:MAG: methyltransferase [Thalassotalea sp.]
MSENNISQLLLRNLALLSSEHALFINLPADNLLNEFAAAYPESKITTYNSNFSHFNQHQQNAQYQSFFGACYTEQTVHDLVVIYYPKAKQELLLLLAMLADKVDEKTRVIIVGEKNGGINSSSKLVADYLTNYQKYDAARHCMLYVGSYIPQQQTFKLDDWLINYQFSVNDKKINVAALPGVFSHKKLDIGTQVLLANLPTIVSGELLDFGCGAGVIACYIAAEYEKITPVLADVSALALYSAEKTLALNNIKGVVVATDSLSHINRSFDWVVTNPPFHQGLKTNYEATETFLTGINKKMRNKGQLVVVANNFLTYRPLMESAFSKVIELTNKNGFCVYHCLK